MQLTGKSIQTLKYFLSQKWKALILVGVLSFLVAFFESLSALAIYPILSIIMPGTGAEVGNQQLNSVINWATARSHFSPLQLSVIFLLMVTIIKLLLSYGQKLYAWVTANQVWRSTQKRMISSLLNADYQFLVNSQKGDLAYRVLTAPGFICKSVNQIPLMAVEVLKVIMMLVMLSFVSWKITAFLLVVSSIYFVINRFLAKHVSYGTGSGRAESAKNQTIHVMNALKGIKSVRLFGVTRHWIDLYVKEIKNFYRYARKDTIVSGIPANMLELVYILFLCGMILYSSREGSSVLNNIPTLGVFAYALLKIMPSLKALSTQWLAFMAMLPHVEATYLAINEAERHGCTETGTEDLKSFNSNIKFKDVSFNYFNALTPAVNDVNLDINRGEFVGIIGFSGSGKTTFLDLLAGLLVPTSGQILIDGHPISSYTPDSRTKHLGYVGQETFLFNDTIRENILFGRYGFSDDEIIEALKKADLWDFVKSLPDGLNYIIADDGMKMSGGQRQRISIARAVLLNPEVLLLDEATSALDHKTEENIMETILRLVNEEGKTVVFVTHRKSAIRHADRVIEMQDGKIINSESFVRS